MWEAGLGMWDAGLGTPDKGCSSTELQWPPWTPVTPSGAWEGRSHGKKQLEPAMTQSVWKRAFKLR